MSNVNENLKMLFGKMEDFVSTKTVVGEAVHVGDVILVPLVDVTFGMGTGVGGGAEKTSGGGGGGVGAKMTPSAVIAVVNGDVKLVSVKPQEGVSKLLDMVPGILEKLNIGGKKKKSEDENESGDE
jgi:uncharacterized spore protein YtfJ